MKKILFSDMDGTIIDNNKMRHEKDGDILRELQRQGHYVVFDTGRNYQEAYMVVNKFQLPFDYLVLNNGAHIVSKDNREVYKQVIPKNIGREIIEHCLKYDDLLIYFFNGKRTIGYCNGKTYEHSEQGNVIVDDIDFMKEYLQVDEFDIIAVNQLDKGIDIVLNIQHYIQEHLGQYAQGCLNTHYLDITAAGCSKGHGIQILNELFDDDVETYAVGDSFNDISMFKVADHAYTFHHVDSEISQYTDQQVDYVYEVVEDMLEK